MEKKKRKESFIVVRVTHSEKAFLIREAKKFQPMGKLSVFLRKVLGLG